MVGAGPASLAAAQAIRERDSLAEITVVSGESHGYYSRPGLAYLLAKEETEQQLFPFTRADLAATGVRFVFGRAVSIDREARRVRLDDGQSLPYDRLLLATGSAAIPLRVPGADLDGVTKLDDLDDARGLIARGRSARAAVVVGGGSTALEIVEGLRARRVRVHYLMRKGRYWSDVLSEPESRIVEQGLRERGIEIHYFAELAAVLGERGRVVGVETTDGSRLRCDLVGVAIGVRPQNQLAEDARLACDRGALVDAYLRTSDERIFAAGDLAETLGARSGRREIEVLWSSAVAKGRVAGRNMADEPVETYATGVPLNVTRIGGFKVTIVGTVGGGNDADLEGLSRGDSEGWRGLGDARTLEWEDAKARVRLALGEREILGAIVMGDQRLSFALQDLVESGAEAAPLVQQLRQPGAPAEQLIGRFHEDRKARRV